MAKLLAIDLDGTLFYPKRKRKCICKKNVLFLRKWIDAGNKVVLVTSRSTQFVEKLNDEIKRRRRRRQSQILLLNSDENR